MPDHCTTLPLAVRVCTPEWASTVPVETVEWDAGLTVVVELTQDVADCVAGRDRCEAQTAQLRSYMQSRVVLLAETQAALDRCQAAQVGPDPAGAWVLGLIAVVGVAARWWR